MVVVAPGAVVVVGPPEVVDVGPAFDVVVVVDPVAQVARVMTLSSRVTAPFRASTLPCTVAPVFSEADVNAKMFPTKLVSVPSVAELPTCQNTLQAWAPLSRLTVLLDAVISVDPAWKMNTALGLFCAFRVTVPVRPRADEAL